MLQKLLALILFAALSASLVSAKDIDQLKKYIPFARAQHPKTQSFPTTKHTWPTAKAENTLTDSMCTTQFTYENDNLYLVNVDGQRFHLLKIAPPSPTLRLNGHKTKKHKHHKHESVDLRPQQSPIKSQGGRPSCTIFASVALLEHLIGKETDLSEQDAYWTICKYLHSPASQDHGVWPEDAANALSYHPICAEIHWPYEQTLTTWIRPLSATQNARHKFCAKDIFTMTNAENTQYVHQMLETGECVVACFRVAWNNQIAAATGQMDLVIDPTTGLPIDSYGGHSMLIVGYDAATKKYILKNSYGKHWGDNGYAHMSAAYFQQYAYGSWFCSSNGRKNKFSLLHKE